MTNITETNTTGIHPVGVHILAEKQNDAVSPGGIHIPEAARDNETDKHTFTVIEDATRTYEPGMRLWVRSFAAFNHKGRKLAFLCTEDVIATLD